MPEAPPPGPAPTTRTSTRRPYPRFALGSRSRQESGHQAARPVRRRARTRRDRMKIAVCVKQIPDPAVPGKLEADHTLDRPGKLILDDSASYGVEMALQPADKAG